jgi:predicted nucleotide-binding protein
MQKQKWYCYTKFPPEVLQSSRSALETGTAKAARRSTFNVSEAAEEWQFDDESEFFAAYRRVGVHGAYYSLELDTLRLTMFFTNGTTRISVEAASRSEIERVFGVFEAAAPNCVLPKEQRDSKLRESLIMFVGHGRSLQWRDLKDHLHEKHGFRVEAYETGARAGYTIVEVLEQLTEMVGFALLVLTGEDEDATGQLHARENVIHEAGLFQGRLGFKRAIVLLEDGCNEFANLAGLQQIRFAKGNIKETFGEVLATIRREFEVD